MPDDNYDTLKFYNDNAKLYFDQTVNADLSRPYESFLAKLPNGAYILDFGCGSGRDSKYFLSHGYEVDPVDGSSALCKIASEYLNHPVKCMLFEDLDEQEKYDGVWACSSILHVEKSQLPQLMLRILRALKPGGILYASFKNGESYEIKEGKYYNFMTTQNMQELLQSLGIKARLIESFETKPSSGRPDNSSYTWNNFLIQKGE